MIIVLKPNISEIDVRSLTRVVEGKGVKVNQIVGTDLTVLGLVGDTSRIDPHLIESHRFVEKVMPVNEPFKRANIKLHPNPTVINVGGSSVGGERLAVIAGPCSVESEEQIVGIAKEVKRHGATFLRGGAFKPRTSPYSFQGLEYGGLDLLMEAKRQTGLPIISEIMSTKDIDKFEERVDVIQVGARNMQNYDLLKALGKVSKPVLLKRGLSATIEEWLMSAEYIMAGGNEQVILCERGIRTFETFTRNTQDISAIPAVKSLSHLPIVVDPSHSTGKYWMVDAMARAAVAAGADGLIIEVHNDPAHALCDGQQSIKPDRFGRMMEQLSQLAQLMGREI